MVRRGHTYSGYENTVKATIEKTVETRHLQDSSIQCFYSLGDSD